MAIRKQGFPFRLKHDKFVSHYGCVLPDPTKKFPAPLDGCKEIIGHMKLPDVNTRIGNSQILYEHTRRRIVALSRHPA